MYIGNGVLFSFCALVCSAFGTRLPFCINGQLTVNDTLPSNSILCDQLNTLKEMTWSLQKAVSSILGSCDANNSCESNLDGDIIISRSNENSILTIARSQYINSGSAAIQCRTKDDPAPATCDLHIVYPSNVTCTASLSSGSWTLSLSCYVTKTYSSRDTYWCAAYRGTTQSSQTIFISNQTYSTTAHSQHPYRQGNCSFSVNNLGGGNSLPNDNQLYFRVDVYPGPTSVDQGPLNIVRPASPNITCPVMVEENVPFNCTCTTPTIGQPQGRLHWSGTASLNYTGIYGDKSLVTPSLTLTRKDHNVTTLTCKVMWADDMYKKDYKVSVGYKAENLRITVSSTGQSKMTVNENETFTLTCQADARPVATVVLKMIETEGERHLNSSNSPLVYVVAGARCQDTGRYNCYSSNLYGQSNNVTQLLFVNCKPRSVTTDLGQLNFQNRSAHILFDITAYPLPSNFYFTYTGNRTELPRNVTNIDISANCTSVSGLITFKCVITVSNVTSPSAQGHYVVTIGNSAGQQEYTFDLLYNALSRAFMASTISPDSHPVTDESFPWNLALIIGLSVGLGLPLVVSITAVVCLWRKVHRNANGSNNSSNGLETTSREAQLQERGQYDTLRTSIMGTEGSYADLNQQVFVDRQSDKDQPGLVRGFKTERSENCLVYENLESDPVRTANVAHSTQAGNYDSLQMWDVGQRSPYAELHPSHSHRERGREFQ